ncbi:MAG: HlyD family efflux transporter periplasmic adaptor subunit [Bacteroidales bacterium]|jgi:multidrug efflux pump subunit AcrA (membrane-fusion protein)|nr:HlyD family efflux transporter periplasmic adaptor subunit [Bacteroidales bacterium]
MKRNIYITLGALAVILLVLWYFLGRTDKTESTIIVPAKFGEFRVLVTTSGELEAKSSEDIKGPSGLRDFRIWQVKINDIIPDGTVVDSGAYVADLDRSDLMNQMKDIETELEKLQSQYTKIQLDTSMEMRNAREELINLRYNLEELQLRYDQSKYEPPATIRQIQIDLEKGQRAYEQAQNNYQLKLDKARANMQEVSATLQQTERKYSQINTILKQFRIYAPKAGMVIHRRNWDGSKQGIGSTIQTGWDNVVASLPNLTEMISKTYVNEIDISKVRTGQKVEIGVDAFPDRSYTGEIIEVANIGEQLRNSNAKVFEVRIMINESDTILRPAMTTKNTIITDVIPNAVFVPLESVYTIDSISFVYFSGRQTRQQVKLGRSNQNEIVVIEGLKEGDLIYLAPPANAEKWKLINL